MQYLASYPTVEKKENRIIVKSFVTLSSNKNTIDNWYYYPLNITTHMIKCYLLICSS